ncbi:thiamin pyrophosphokinase 1-like [Dendronephthya gigantea]|uniref:thiamin pyrophosphokinase 1-like n=1 Tax=Dendronephthya gigantea TaxID=151771 RepID=UPI00106B372B|nr:thiamin pyrophosphokinase 1-like [Dendronephthya gigantea]
MDNETRYLSPFLYLINSQTDKNVGLIILNRPLCGKYEKLKALWKKASVTICVDGGANELQKICVENGNFEWIPQYITGDFDSIREEVLAYYKDKGTKIIPTPDQNYTDFAKAIRYLFSNCDEQVKAVVVISEFSGLLDQTLGNINTLFIASNVTDKPVIILASDCLAFLLQPGKHSIDVNNGYEGLKCGLLPIGGKCNSVTTSGLKWNLTNHALEFGQTISTSNALDGSGIVNIETSHPLVWTMETL